MYQIEKPAPEELPSHAQLMRSTVIAAITALAILVTMVLPAEYAVDPTGIGRVLGLTEMGTIKQELAREAAQDHHDGHSSLSDGLWESITGLFVGTAHAQDQQADLWLDKLLFRLEPGDTHELKLTMEEGAKAIYRMVVTGGRVNYDLHAHGDGQDVSYERGRGVTGAEGEFTAAFDGNHGWFFRNRDDQSLTINLSIRGYYSDIVQSD